MKQESFSDMEYRNRKKKTKREEFLEIMDEIIPWDEWVGIIRPYYPAGKRGHPPIEIEIMLRMYLLQCWFNLSDEGVEDAIYDSYVMRKFMGINFFEQDVPDATTLISAPSSTKNAEKKRDPEMHQTKKGNQWHFGMKCHTGVDAGSDFVHTVEATAANVHDVTVAAKLLREDDEVVYGNSAYLGLEKRDEIKKNPQLSAIEYRINRRPGRLPKVSDNAIDWERYIEKPQIRCALQGRTPLPDCKEHFWLPEDSLPWAAKKSQPITRTLRQRESVYACQGGWFPTPRLGFLRPLGRMETWNWAFSP